MGASVGARFPSNPFIIRAPFFLLFSFKKETPKLKGQKGTTGVPCRWEVVGEPGRVAMGNPTETKMEN